MAVAHKGSISMGLVLIPVGLYKTTIDNDIHFNQLCKDSKERGYTSALKAPVRCFGNHLSGKRKSWFRTDNDCGGAAILKTRTSRMGTPVGC